MKDVERLRDLLPSGLDKLPNVSQTHSNLGEEMIRLHLSNAKKMNWYLAGYNPISKKFFGYFEDPNDTISFGSYSLEEILIYGKRGQDWEPVVDEDWKPKMAREIAGLQGYVELMSSGTDDFT